MHDHNLTVWIVGVVSCICFLIFAGLGVAAFLTMKRTDPTDPELKDLLDKIEGKQK